MRSAKRTTLWRYGLLGVLAAGLVLAGAAGAGDVAWKLPEHLGVGQVGSLELVFSDTRPSAPVVLPEIDGLRVLGNPSESTSVSIINRDSRSMFRLGYSVRPERQGNIEVPGFVVETVDGRLRVPAATLPVGRPMLPGAGGSAAAPLDDAVVARLLPSERRPYAGEVFELDAVIAIAIGGASQSVGKPEWDAPGVVAEAWGGERSLRIEGARGVVLRTRAYAPEAGTLELPPLIQEIEIETGRMRRDFFFARPERARVRVATDAVALEVKPLLEGAPEDFTGAVGRFELRSKVVPENASAGEPITWTLTLEGTGNWPAGVSLPPRAVPGDVRTIQPRTRRDFAAGDLFTGSLSEDLVLVPTRSGEMRLDPVRFSFFDPATNRYETLVATPPMLTIAGSAAAVPGATAESMISTNDTDGAAVPAASPSGRVEPTLPRGALRGSGGAVAPISSETLAAGSALPAALLGVLWIVLALRGARLGDPRRPQREALQALPATIEAAAGARSRGARSAALLAWQRAAAGVFELEHATPTAAVLPSVDARLLGSEEREGWARLWAESDRSVYAAGADLEPGWCERAAELGRRIRLPRFNPFHAVRPLHLATAAAAACLLLVVASTVRAEPVESYQSGRFEEARRGLQARAAEDPRDWVARYNLGLAHAQLGDTPRALGETAAAFLLRPGNPSVAWNLNAFAAQVPRLDPTLRALAERRGPAALAARMSPANWQRVLWLGSAIFCVGAGFVLWQRHRRNGGRARLGLGGVLAGATLGLVAALALAQYGVLADPHAALVAEDVALRSVPTEAAQRTKMLPAGTLVVVGHEFLGWVRVELADGESGWLRGTGLVSFYDSSPV